MIYTPPKDYYKAYVPKGESGWTKLGRGITGGITNFANQYIAIKQYEAEKEAARQKAEQERIEKEAKAAFEQQKFGWQQQVDVAELDIKRATAEVTADYREKQMAQIDANIAKLRAQLGDDEGGMPKGLDKMYKAGLPVYSALGNSMYNLVTQAGTYGFSTGDWSWFDELEPRLDDPKMLTYKEARVDMLGMPIETTKAATDMARVSSMYYQIMASSNNYRETPKQWNKPESAEPAKTTPNINSIEFRADRKRAIDLLKAGRTKEADALMDKYNLTKEQYLEILRAAGKSPMSKKLVR